MSEGAIACGAAAGEHDMVWGELKSDCLRCLYMLSECATTCGGVVTGSVM